VHIAFIQPTLLITSIILASKTRPIAKMGLSFFQAQSNAKAAQSIIHQLRSQTHFIMLASKILPFAALELWKFKLPTNAICATTPSPPLLFQI